MNSNFKPGNQLKVKSIDYGHMASKMLIDMGFTPGTIISVEKEAPFGEPVILKVRNYSLALRKNDLKALNVEIVKNERGCLNKAPKHNRHM